MLEWILRIRDAAEPGVVLWFTTLPVVLETFSQVSLIGIAVNLLVIPLVQVVLISGILAMAVGAVHLGLGSMAGIPAYAVLRLYELLGSLSERLPLAMWDSGTAGDTPLCMLLSAGRGHSVGGSLPETETERRRACENGAQGR